MPIKIRCACGNVLYAPEEKLGEAGTCPQCNRTVIVELPPEEKAKMLFQPTPKNTTIPPKKTPWICKILGCMIYIFFVSLVIGLLFLHITPNTTLENFHWWNQAYLQKQWQEIQEPILMIKNIQRQWYQCVISKCQASSHQSVPKKEPTLEEKPASEVPQPQSIPISTKD